MERGVPEMEAFPYEDVGALDHLAARVDQLNELVSGFVWVRRLCWNW